MEREEKGRTRKEKGKTVEAVLGRKAGHCRLGQNRRDVATSAVLRFSRKRGVHHCFFLQEAERKERMRVEHRCSGAVCCVQQGLPCSCRARREQRAMAGKAQQV